jgi:hypothetical protein
MAVIKAFSIAGMKLWFYSNDHEPPHFHAKRNGEWEIRVKFLESDEEMFELVSRKTAKATVSTQDTKMLQEMVNEHRPALLREWENLHP